jgi:hypothetical protein
MNAKAKGKRASTIRARALLHRIIRVLFKDDWVLKATRGTRMGCDAGNFFNLDLCRNEVLTDDVDRVVLGRELGVLKDYEYLARG